MLTTSCCTQWVPDSGASLVKLFDLKQVFLGPEQQHKYLKRFNININTMDLHKDVNTKHFMQK